MHLFTQAGMDPRRLAVIGLGEYRPAQSNDTEQGRNINRRVLLVILSGIWLARGRLRRRSRQTRTNGLEPHPLRSAAAATTVQAAPLAAVPRATDWL